MKTSISVMGLNDTLQHYLNTMEYENLSEDVYNKKMKTIKQIFEAAVKEASHVMSTF